jgi:phosphoglucosamine mutase
VKQAIVQAEEKLNGAGRLLIRRSGTEPLIRVMAEGEDDGVIGPIVDSIIHAIEQAATE